MAEHDHGSTGDSAATEGRQDQPGGGHDLPTEHDGTELPGSDNDDSDADGAGYGNHGEAPVGDPLPDGTEVPDDDIDGDGTNRGLGRPGLYAGDAIGAAEGGAETEADMPERRDG